LLSSAGVQHEHCRNSGLPDHLQHASPQAVSRLYKATADLSLQKVRYFQKSSDMSESKIRLPILPLTCTVQLIMASTITRRYFTNSEMFRTVFSSVGSRIMLLSIFWRICLSLLIEVYLLSRKFCPSPRRTPPAHKQCQGLLTTDHGLEHNITFRHKPFSFSAYGSEAGTPNAFSASMKSPGASVLPRESTFASKQECVWRCAPDYQPTLCSNGERIGNLAKVTSRIRLSNSLPNDFGMKL
jgi:hypothetical protein